YSLLPKIVKELDFGVKSRVNSTFQSRHLKIGVSTEQLIGEIIELTEQKRKIVNLRYIVNLALERISPDDRQILEARIINKKTFQKISEENEIALRTVFRRLANAEAAFAGALNRAGYGEDWFEKEYGDDKFISPIHERVLNDKYFVAKNL
ncbi:MAG: hypothetical protein NC179_05790, partial [[Eubacterium] siraeum]|nr:hypothetical protein [[Eubacterium] siraeum]